MIQALTARVKEISSYLQFKRDCKVVFSTDAGKRVLSYIMNKGSVTTPVASTDRDETLRNAGAQRLALSILKATYRTETELEQHLENEME